MPKSMKLRVSEGDIMFGRLSSAGHSWHLPAESYERKQQKADPFVTACGRKIPRNKLAVVRLPFAVANFPLGKALCAICGAIKLG